MRQAEKQKMEPIIKKKGAIYVDPQIDPQYIKEDRESSGPNGWKGGNFLQRNGICKEKSGGHSRTENFDI